MQAKKTENKIPFTADILIMLIPFCLLSVYFYGLTAVKLIFASIITAIICDFTGCVLLKREIELSDLSAVNTGIITSLLLSSSTPVYVAVLTCAFAICVGKLPFGNYKNSPFTPAAVGIAFAIVCFPDYMFNYIPSLRDTGIFTSSLASMLTQGNTVNMTVPGLLSILVGNCPGPIGATCTAALLATLVYLLIRRPYAFFSAAGFISICCLFAVLFPRVLSGRQASVLMELCSGMLMFTAVFLIPWPNKEFSSPLSALLYGITGGVFQMLIRYFGTFEEGAVFAVLFCDAISFLFIRKEKTQKDRKENLNEQLS